MSMLVIINILISIPTLISDRPNNTNTNTNTNIGYTNTNTNTNTNIGYTNTSTSNTARH